MAAGSVPLIDAPTALHTRRYVEAAAAVALWMAIGFAFHLSGNSVSERKVLLLTSIKGTKCSVK